MRGLPYFLPVSRIRFFLLIESFISLTLQLVFFLWLKAQVAYFDHSPSFARSKGLILRTF